MERGMKTDSQTASSDRSEEGRRRPTPAELHDILADHERWLASGGTEGVRAFAAPLDLSCMDLGSANLQRSMVRGVDFRNSNLEGANLSGVQGLTAERLAGANLSDAELPPSVSRFETLAVVEDLSKSSKTILMALLGACAYCWLTIGTTMDVRLLSNRGTSPLPIVQTNVPIATFFWIVPTALLFGSLYLHVRLQKLWQALGSLPAVFPNGMRLEDRVNPWLVTSIACDRAVRPKPAVQRFAWAEQAFGEFVTWWFIPATIAAFWLRYLSRQDPRGTILHVSLLVAAFVVAVIFRRAARAAISGHDTDALRTTTPGLIASAVSVAILAAGFSGAALGVHHLEFYGASFFPDLRGAHLSGENLRGVDLRKADATGVVLDGADIRDAHLRGMQLAQSNLRAADLRNAKLDGVLLVGADLRDAQLQEATFAGAQLKGVRFSEKTDMRGARFEGADLRGVDLKQAPLAGVVMSTATQLDPDGLRGTTLTGAVFTNMTLTKLDIRRADFTAANLDMAQFTGIRAGKQTKFNGASLRKAQFAGGVMKKSLFEGAKLQDARFEGIELLEVNFKDAELQRVVFSGVALPEADFTRARLDGAKFEKGTNLKGAKFEDARLPGADLSGAINLKQKQLDTACGDANTRLPDSTTPLTVKPCPPR
jgi:uncharacterized protein YjbI with pentapeptide repeats